MITSPSPPGPLAGSTQTFTWNGTASEYLVVAGSQPDTPAMYDYFNSGSLGGATTVDVTGLPTNGSTVYVTLWYRYGAGDWNSVTNAHTAATVTPPAVTNPVPPGPLAWTTQIFTWTGSADEYWVVAGPEADTVRMYEYFDSGSLGISTSVEVTGLPTDGSTVYVTLWYRHTGGPWTPLTYTYTAANAAQWNLFYLSSESDFLFDFLADGTGGMSNGSIDAYDGCYELTVNGVRFTAAGRTHEAFYDDRGFRTSTATIGDLVVQRYGYVPEVGLSFARYLDVVQNGGAQDAVVTFSYCCNLGSDGSNEWTDSADGDGSIETNDTWALTDDTDDAGDPSLGHVFFGAGGDVGLDTIVYSPGEITWTYQVLIPAGGRAAIMVFGIQEQTRALAEVAAVALASLQEQALDGVESEINNVVNCPIGP